jgi:hypothetical protein
LPSQAATRQKTRRKARKKQLINKALGEESAYLQEPDELTKT